MHLSFGMAVGNLAEAPCVGPKAITSSLALYRGI